jgi:biopolymer transport protein ExbD
VIFLLLAALVPTPGIPLRLPVAENLPGIDQPTVSVAIDSSGQFYFANKIVLSEIELKTDLRDAAKKSAAPLTLLILADKAATYNQLLHLTLLARDAGILQAQLATLPRVTDALPRNE